MAPFSGGTGWQENLSDSVGSVTASTSKSDQVTLTAGSVLWQGGTRTEAASGTITLNGQSSTYSTMWSTAVYLPGPGLPLFDPAQALANWKNLGTGLASVGPMLPSLTSQLSGVGLPGDGPALLVPLSSTGLVVPPVPNMVVPGAYGGWLGAPWSNESLVPANMGLSPWSFVVQGASYWGQVNTAQMEAMSRGRAMMSLSPLALYAAPTVGVQVNPVDGTVSLDVWSAGQVVIGRGVDSFGTSTTANTVSQAGLRMFANPGESIFQSAGRQFVEMTPLMWIYQNVFPDYAASVRQERRAGSYATIDQVAVAYANTTADAGIQTYQFATRAALMGGLFLIGGGGCALLSLDRIVGAGIGAFKGAWQASILDNSETGYISHMAQEMFHGYLNPLGTAVSFATSAVGYYGALAATGDQRTALQAMVIGDMAGSTGAALVTSWLGGGIKGGITHGTTDELGYAAEQDPVSVHDFHATMLHLLGVDHKRLAVKFQGLDVRLTGISGDVVKEILA
jgi:hypothetical protein